MTDSRPAVILSEQVRSDRLTSSLAPLRRIRPSSIFVFLFLTAYLLVTLFPVYWIVVSSLKLPIDTLAIPPVWLFWPTLDAYRNVFVLNSYYKYFVNSAVIAIGTTLISLSFGSMAAYALDRHPFPLGRLISYVLLTTRMIFPIVYAIPMFVMMNAVGLLDTQFGLIVAYTTFSLPYAVWIMQGFFNAVPTEIDDAAMVDGCSRFGAFWRVILPLSAPGLAAAAIFIVLLAWNEFMFALVLAGGGQAKTLPVAAAMLIGQREIQWNELTAVATATLLPLLIFFIAVQRHFVRGMIAGAVK